MLGSAGQSSNKSHPAQNLLESLLQSLGGTEEAWENQKANSDGGQQEQNQEIEVKKADELLANSLDVDAQVPPQQVPSISQGYPTQQMPIPSSNFEAAGDPSSPVAIQGQHVRCAAHPPFQCKVVFWWAIQM